MKNEKILVTVVLGFIGSNLIDYLIDKKKHIINVDKIIFFKFFNVKKHSKNKLYKFYKLDITDKKIFKLQKKKTTIIFNCCRNTC